MLPISEHPGTELRPCSSDRGSTDAFSIRPGTHHDSAHTNADVADPGVSDALAERFDLRDLRPLQPRPEPRDKLV